MIKAWGREFSPFAGTAPSWARKSLGRGRGCCSTAHVQRMRECEFLWALPWVAVQETSWEGRGTPLSSGTYRSQVGSPEKCNAMAQPGVHLAMVTTLLGSSFLPSQLLPRIRSEKLPRYFAYSWATQTKCQTAAVCMYRWLPSKGLIILTPPVCSPQELGTGISTVQTWAASCHSQGSQSREAWDTSST